MSLSILPSDLIINYLMPMLSLPDCAAASRVCKEWHRIIGAKMDDRLWKEVFFGRAEWLKIPDVTDVGEQPAMPPEKKAAIIAKLKERCDCFNKADPIKPHRFQKDPQFKVGNIRRWKTRKVFLLPETINGVARTVDVTGRVFHFLKTKNPDGTPYQYMEHSDGTVYEFICGDENSEFRKEVAPKSCICIVTTDVLPGSRGITQQAKETLVKRKGYRPPPPNEAAVVVNALNIGPSKEGKEYFFGREEKGCWTYTATSGTNQNRPVIIGAAGPSGSEVEYRSIFDVSGNIGVLAVEEIL